MSSQGPGYAKQDVGGFGSTGAQARSGLAPGSKLVIALCRRPFDNLLGDEKLETPVERSDVEAAEGVLAQALANSSGYLEYSKGNLTQLYQVEEVLSIIDVAKSDMGAQQNSMPGMDAHQQ